METEESLSTAKILIVDSSKVKLQLLTSLFNSKGCSTEACTGPLEGLSRFERLAYDLVIADFALSELTCREFIARLRSIDAVRLNATPIIIFSELASEKVARGLGGQYVNHIVFSPAFDVLEQKVFEELNKCEVKA